MIIEFYKYQATGNDFIIIDDRDNNFDILDQALIAALCERRMGIGADGLILLRDHNRLDFEMIYFNSDGNKSSMCGNGGRCIVSFAHLLGIIKDKTTFMAVDGEHNSRLTDNNVSIQMKNVTDIKGLDGGLLLDTGSPHYVKIVDDLEAMDVNKEGRKIRYSNNFRKEGVNVNFVLDDVKLKMRTYERGVEAETLSCGTGVVATAIAMHYAKCFSEETIFIETKGGVLRVDFELIKGCYQNIWLSGDASMVYVGDFEC
tara:strand:+ start:655 stop:1428 length:774 start_codon:yes stop_codon:yes gene_type:complete